MRARNVGYHFVSLMTKTKMKPRRIQKHIKPTLQEKVIDIGHKSMPTQSKATSRASHPTQIKPFAGKVFYLDLPSNRQAEALENDIKQLGGTVEKFFSKEIKYLVSNKREAKYVQCLRHDSPVPSPDSGHGSPHPHSSHSRPPESRRDSLKGASQGQTDTAVTSRGKSLVERVVKEQERIQMNKILSHALEWGVKILYIDDVIAYVEKKKKNVTTQCTETTAGVKKSAKAESTGRPAFQKYKGGRISKPFVKVEDSSRHYRPIYLAMPNMPEFNLTTISPCSPFFVDDKDLSGKKYREHRNRGARDSASEERGQARHRKNKDKKRGGYCECCTLKYDNLRTHLQSERHKAFSRSDEYLAVDRLVSTLHCNFIHIESKRRKCSISSILLAPGSYRRTEERPERDADNKETEEGQRTVCPATWCGEPPTKLHTELSLKQHFVPAAAPTSHSEGDNSDNVPDRPQLKHRPLARKRPCRQGSLCTSHRAELVQTPRPEAETAPSRGESYTSDPASISRDALAHQESHRTLPDKNSSTSHIHREDLHNGFPSKSFNVTSSQHEMPTAVKLQDSPLTECVQELIALPENIPGVPECEGGNLNTQSHPPVRALQRRVRVYKRKRRKVDSRLTTEEHVEPSGIHDSSIMKLWRLFQSSEDMDVEFLGFED